MTWFAETLYGDVQQRHRIAEVLYEVKTDFQHLIIFDSPVFGRMLALDGVVQVTERDEFIYHEMLSHVPIVAHGAASRVLIIGGGDGGILREVLRHPGVERAVLVEIDAGVVEMSKTYLPMICRDAFDDPRSEVVIADGARFVAETEERFDVIIVDSTDPAGPGEVLFGEPFYRNCRRCLRDGGIVVTQNGVPFMQGGELTSTYRRLKPSFADVGCYVAAIPTYQFGFMALGWASLDPAHRATPREVVGQRLAQAGITGTRYYNADIHVGCFMLPSYVRDLLTD